MGGGGGGVNLLNYERQGNGKSNNPDALCRLNPITNDNVIGLDWQNNNFARVSGFYWYISLPSLYDYDAKVPNFIFCRGHELKTTTCFFFS